MRVSDGGTGGRTASPMSRSGKAAARDVMPSSGLGKDRIPRPTNGPGKGSGKGSGGPSRPMGTASAAIPRHAAWRRSPEWHILRLVLPACLAAVAVAGCGHATAADHSPTTSSTLSSAARAVLSGWTAAQNAFADAERQPNGAYSPALTATMVDPELTNVRRQLLGDEHAGLIGRGSVDLGHPKVVSLSNSSATVTSCIYDALVLVDAKTGSPAPGPLGQPAHAFVRSTMVPVSTGGSPAWKEADSSVSEGACAG